jgi:ribosome-binding protein aMBF1 (putative translation factor)
VAERSKAWVGSLSPAEIAGSNPDGGMDVCVSCVLYRKRTKGKARTIRTKKYGKSTENKKKVAERSKARVYGRSLDGIAGSNPAGGMDGYPV